MKKSTKILIAASLLILTGGLIYLSRDNIYKFFFQPRQSSLTTGVNRQNLTKVNNNLNRDLNTNQTEESEIRETVEVTAENLEIPWEIAFLPEGDLLVTERPGNLVRIKGREKETIIIEGVEHRGEGGLLGLALDPDFPDNQRIYLYLTAKNDAGLINRVESYQFDLNQNRLSQKQVVIDGIPGASYHDGGRIAFGPEGYLYITTGDSGNENLAQDPASLAGKILRLNPDGSVPEDNPFNNAVWSYGHRNPQGLTWDSQNRLWATEHGRSGIASGFDELNLIEKGKNYGWPEIQGDETKEGMVTPVINSGADETWAPSGAAYYNGSIFFSGLRGQTLYQAKIEKDRVSSLLTNFQEDYGRLRAVVLGPDDYLYFSTSNTDGRGDPFKNDDKVIKVDLTVF